MFILYACMALVAFVILVALVTQVIAPLVNGDPLFPLLRSDTAKEKLREAEDKLEEALDVADLQERVSALSDKVKSKLQNGEK